MKFGQTKSSNNIHRLVWGEGVKNKEDAINFVNHLIADQLINLKGITLKVLDLGCGVGATLGYLYQHNKAPSYEGITISKKQVILANELTADKIKIREGDFHDLTDFESKDLIYQIESFVHSGFPKKLLENVQRILNQDGFYCICDDFRSPKELNNQEQDIVDTYKKGWRIGSLLTISELEEMAKEFNLELIVNTDLTAMLRLNTWRDLLIRIGVNIYSWIPFESTYWDSLLGGDALQISLSKGYVEYRFLVLKKIK